MTQQPPMAEGLSEANRRLLEALSPAFANLSQGHRVDLSMSEINHLLNAARSQQQPSRLTREEVKSAIRQASSRWMDSRDTACAEDVLNEAADRLLSLIPGEDRNSLPPTRLTEPGPAAGVVVAESGRPKRGEIRDINGQLCRFIEEDDRGDVWEILGAARTAQPNTGSATDGEGGE